MAAGIVYHNITTASGVTWAVASWVPDTSAPDVGALPVHVSITSAGALIAPALEAGNLATILAQLQAGAAALGKAEDAASASADVGIPAMVIQKATPADTAGTDGDYTMLQIKDGRLWISNPPSNAFSTRTTINSGTTAYAVNDVVGGAVDLGVLGNSGQIVEIVSASLQYNNGTLISGMTSYRVYFYDITPPSAIADSTPWDFASADQSNFLGYIDLGTIVDLGTTLFMQVDNIGKRVKLSGTHLFAYLVSNGAYTPTAQAHILTIHTQGY